MNGTRYMISDTAKQVEVEAHVLRYWEEELDLPIARNEMGHRYYTGENIQLFKNIKELKERGFQLKAIKMLLPDIENQEVRSMDNIIHLRDELNRRVITEEHKGEPITLISQEEEETNLVAKEDFELQEVEDNKMQQFEMILANIIKQAMKENNQELGKELGQHVGDRVIKEMDYLVRNREEKEEERFKKLDETIRTLQMSRRQIAASRPKAKKPKKIKTKRFGFLKKKHLNPAEE